MALEALSALIVDVALLPSEAQEWLRSAPLAILLDALLKEAQDRKQGVGRAMGSRVRFRLFDVCAQAHPLLHE